MANRVPGEQSVLARVISAPDAVKVLGEKGIKISERGLKERARELGAYRQIGNAVFFLDEDLRRIMEPQEPCSNSSNVQRKARTGTRGEPSKVVGLSEARAKLQSAKRTRGSRR